jgi:nitrate reductase gamma subunit
LLVIAGVWAFAEKNRLGFDGVDINSLQARYVSIFSIVFDLTILVIVLGMIIFLLAFAGCIGALRENICLLKAVSI